MTDERRTKTTEDQVFETETTLEFPKVYYQKGTRVHKFTPSGERLRNQWRLNENGQPEVAGVYDQYSFIQSGRDGTEVYDILDRFDGTLGDADNAMSIYLRSGGAARDGVYMDVSELPTNMMDAKAATNAALEDYAKAEKALATFEKKLEKGEPDNGTKIE